MPSRSRPQADAKMTDEAIFADVSDTIRKALQHVKDTNPAKTNISSTSLELSLNKLMGMEVEKV